MGQVRSVVGSALFFVIAPGTIAGVFPWWISRWELNPALFGWAFLRMVGALLVLAGLAVLLDSFARFALQGLGTPVPIKPPRFLVMGGFYRFVRNPMYVAVVSLIVGQGLMFGNTWVLLYALLIWLTTHVFIVAYEEPILRRTFGPEYNEFCTHVPRWRPWRGVAGKN